MLRKLVSFATRKLLLRVASIIERSVLFASRIMSDGSDFLKKWRNSAGQHRPKALDQIATAAGAELVVRCNFILSAAIGFVTALMLTTCASPSRVVWEYYDQCARENPSFLPMAECGRQKRLAECVPNNTCSPEGTMFMQYIDTLVLAVKKKELTETEAMRRYTEYKAGGTPSHP
jgi:hypothetical protein